MFDFGKWLVDGARSIGAKNIAKVEPKPEPKPEATKQEKEREVSPLPPFLRSNGV